jgi:hypothetical protein
MPDFKHQREQLDERELRLLGIRDEAVLRAMRTVPREDFVSQSMREFAYRNAPLPIGMGQTISQPLVVASMTEALGLSPVDKVLWRLGAVRDTGRGSVTNRQSGCLGPQFSPGRCVGD